MGDELAAMASVNGALEALEPDETARVLRWALDKFGSAHGGVKPETPLIPHLGEDEEEGKDPADAAQWESLHELVDAASPSSPADYALVASYWFQIVQGAADVTGAQVNAELKHLGHGAKNITEAFNHLMSRTPTLAMQVRKSGTSRQARKKYRLTGEGKKRVERMVAGVAD